MEILFYFGCALFGLSLGYFIVKSNNVKSCQHKWVVFHETDVLGRDRFGQVVVKGFVKFYECEHCKKLKKGQIMVKD